MVFVRRTLIVGVRWSSTSRDDDDICSFTLHRRREIYIVLVRWIDRHLVVRLTISLSAPHYRRYSLRARAPFFYLSSLLPFFYMKWYRHVAWRTSSYAFLPALLLLHRHLARDVH